MDDQTPCTKMKNLIARSPRNDGFLGFGSFPEVLWHHFQTFRLLPEAPDPLDQVLSAASQNFPTTRAVGQDDGGYTNSLKSLKCSFMSWGNVAQVLELARP